MNTIVRVLREAVSQVPLVHRAQAVGRSYLAAATRLHALRHGARTTLSGWPVRYVTVIRDESVWHRGPVTTARLAAELACPSVATLVREMSMGLADTHPSAEWRQEAPPLSGLRLASASARALAALACGLQQAAGSPVTFHTAVCHTSSDDFLLVCEFEYLDVALAAVEEAVAMSLAAKSRLRLDPSEHVARVARRLRLARPDAWTAALLQEARDRGIPARCVEGTPIVELGEGRYLQRLNTWWPLGDEGLAPFVDNALTAKALLRRAGLPVLPNAWVASLREAKRFAEDHGFPVTGWRSGHNPIALYEARNLKTLERSWKQIRKTTNGGHIIERSAAGRRRTFIVWRNRRKTENENSILEIATGRDTLEEPGERDTQPTPLLTRAVDAMGLRTAVITLAAPTDAARMPHESDDPITFIAAIQSGARLAAALADLDPDLRRACASDVYSDRFPAPCPAGIPKVAVTGTDGKTTTTRLLAAILKAGGKRVGVKSSLGVEADGDLLASGDTSAVASARLLLSHSTVDVVVMETPRGGLLSRGMPFAAADVGVVLNVERDHLGTDGIMTLEDLAKVKGLVAAGVRESGCIVLNAEDPHVARMSARTAGRVAWVWPSPRQPPKFVQEHVFEGGLAAVLENAAFAIWINGELNHLAATVEVPLTLNGLAPFTYVNVLAASASACVLGVSVETIRTVITSPDAALSIAPGRLNRFALPDATVLIDAAHNPHALRHLMSVVVRLPASRRVAILSAPGNRSDGTIRELGSIAGEVCDSAVIREWPDLRGREQGEVAALIRDGFLQANPQGDARILLMAEREVLRVALKSISGGDLLVATSTLDVTGVLEEIETYRGGGNRG